ncbi:MAG: hypothetical protein M3N19_02595 [Candidatus Eremiobacteraeota bacterium]|nr:hypothetical protein [Candidatus Eremiobacteraeota bacterium]
MSLFGAHSPSDVAEAADKFISKMDESQLAALTAGHMATMPVEGRCALVESILDAFRHRGESSEDVAEAAHAGLEAMQSGDISAIAALLTYVDQNTGLLKEAATALIEEHPEMIQHLPGAVVDGISSKLAAR